LSPPEAEAAPPEAAERLLAFERELDPARPAAGGRARVLGYGEVSAVLSLAALPGQVCKRLSGFADADAAARHAELVREYLRRLEAAGVAVVPTQAAVVSLPRRRPVVYLLQPALDPARLGHALLREAGDGALAACVDHVLEAVLRVWRDNAARGGDPELTLDAQLSNWHFPDVGGAPGLPRLLDVGTPFLRRGGRHAIASDFFLAAVPPGVRAWYRRRRAVERYLDHYFEPRSLALDLLGNFHKEGRPDRVPLGADRVNRWLAAHADVLGAVAPVAPAAVAAAYRQDAAQLELFLRVRRLDRFVRTHLLRSRYDFVLPGPIRR
jgi:hypothetical protein